MLSQVLWALDKETDYKTFERLCVDLLFRNGFKNIIPFGGTHDHARDAEAHGQEGTDEAGRITFFQFSKQEDWRRKLRAEVQKVAKAGHKISRFVLVTSQEAHGRDIDLLRQEVYQEFGWDLAVLSREWLRLQLEEAHPDLATKHLGVELPHREHLTWKGLKFQSPIAGDSKKAWALFMQEDYEAAAVELRNYLAHNPDELDAWEMFAWCLYATFRYNDALTAINKALDLPLNSAQTVSIRACILAESGRERGDLARIKEANSIFASLLSLRNDGLVHYNYANTLSYLSSHEEAISHYRMALEFEPSDAQIWKNLATSYHEVGQHDQEMACLDRAIELNPQLTQALVSKGVSLMVDFDRPQECIELIELAISVDKDSVQRWSHTWYWAAEACRRLKNHDEGLKWVRQGLRLHPGEKWLKQLEYQILSDLGRDIPGRIGESLEFFIHLVKDQPRHYEARVDAVQILDAQGRTKEAWDLLEAAFQALDNESCRGFLEHVGADLCECCRALNYLPGYLSFRKRYPVSDYRWEGAPSASEDFFDFILVAGAVSYGKARDSILDIDSPPWEDSGVERAHEIFRELLQSIMYHVSISAIFLSGNLSREFTPEVIQRCVKSIIIFTSRVVGDEWIRQFGALCGHLAIPEDIQGELVEILSEVDVGATMAKAIILLLSNATGINLHDMETEEAD